MASEMKSIEMVLEQEFDQKSTLEFVCQPGFRQNESKKEEKKYEEARIRRQWSTTDDSQFQDEKKCIIL